MFEIDSPEFPPNGSRRVVSGVTWAVVLVVCCSLLTSASCSRRAAWQTEDLLKRFVYTENAGEPDAIELGSLQARQYLVEGWSAAETLPGGEVVLWPTARQSAIRFSLLQPAEREMLLRCASFPARPGRPQRIAIHLNYARVATLRLEAGTHEYRIPLPARFQQPGRNLLTFSGGARGIKGQRLGVAYQTLRFVSAAPRHAAARLEHDALVLEPPGTVDYFLRIPRSAELIFGLQAPTALRVSVQREADAEQTLLRKSGSSSSVRLDLKDYAGELVRLAFRAEEEGAPVTVRRPEIRTRLAPEQPSRAPRRQPRANVLVYLIDTLRADHLGCYGYGRPTSPRIDALAAEGILFANVVAQASWTRPATASILTGLYPPGHGAVTLRQGLRSDVPTLAEVLAAHGYQTAGFVTNANVAGRWGFQRGFDVYEYLPEDDKTPNVHVRSDELNEHVLAWLRDQYRSDRPFFLYVHATDPHGPYTPPDPFADRFVEGGRCASGASRPLLTRLERRPEAATPEQIRLLEGCYDAEIASTDSNFGALLDELERLGLHDTTVVVVTADHGEEFFDHGGFEHGRTLYQEQLHVPLVLRLPQDANSGRRVTVRASQVDIVPTLLDYLGVPIPTPVQGRSLLPSLGDETRDGDIDAFSQTTLGGRYLEAVTTGSLKVIHMQDRRRERMEAYDLRADGQERDDLIDRKPVLKGYARQALLAWAADIPKGEHGSLEPPSEPEIDSATMQRLRALGYAQ